MAYFKATIELLIWTDSEAESCDAISETLRPLLQEFNPASALIDWKYAEMGDPAPDSGEGFEYEAIEAGTPVKPAPSEAEAEKAARAAGWYVNAEGNFETVLGTDSPDVITSVSPTDPGGWKILCEMEGIEINP